MRRKAHETGQVLDAEAVRKLDEVEDKWNAFRTFIANTVVDLPRQRYAAFMD